MTVSNGLAWDEGRNRMYHVDSWTQRIDVLDHNTGFGDPADRRPFVRVDPRHGLPDGLAVDAEGGVWVCLFGGGVLHRYGPDGELTEIVPLPVTNPTSLAFGGDDLRTLFVTAARLRLTDAELVREPLTGAVLALDPGVSGRPVHAMGALPSSVEL